MKTSLPIYSEKCTYTKMLREKNTVITKWKDRGRERKRDREYAFLFHTLRFAREISYWIMSTSVIKLGRCCFSFVCYYHIIKAWTCAPKQVICFFPLFAFQSLEKYMFNDTGCLNEYADRFLFFWFASFIQFNVHYFHSPMSF